jgi:hypothetical protein
MSAVNANRARRFPGRELAARNMPEKAAFSVLTAGLLSKYLLFFV